MIVLFCKICGKWMEHYSQGIQAFPKETVLMWGCVVCDATCSTPVEPEPDEEAQNG